jgi:hypothetical protein
MATLTNNPWAARFEPLLDKEIIKQRAFVTVPKITGFYAMSRELACRQLENALKTVFYPTTQCVDILHRLVDSAYAHCVTTYPDGKTFLSGVYAKNSPLSDFYPAILLTGLAGTGKTQLMNALSRIQIPDYELIVNKEHSPFPIKGGWRLVVNARSNPVDILKTLSQTDGSAATLIDKCRKIAFRDGRPFLSADEFQFLTGSSNANTRVTQALLLLAYIGIPWCYNANFSLVARLLKRPEEDRQRLLSDWIILQPDPASSKDWIETLQSQKNVAPEILTFDPSADASDIHSYTAGRKRATTKLLVIACRQEHSRRGTVNITAIREAYHSQEYAVYREESEILATQAIQNNPHKTRKDLWCPLPLQKGATAKLSESDQEQRDKNLADSELLSSLNSKERSAVEEIQKHIKKNRQPTGTVIPLRRKSAPTADDLKRNANWFKNQI